MVNYDEATVKLTNTQVNELKFVSICSKLKKLNSLDN